MTSLFSCGSNTNQDSIGRPEGSAEHTLARFLSGRPLESVHLAQTTFDVGSAFFVGELAGVGPTGRTGMLKPLRRPAETTIEQSPYSRNTRRLRLALGCGVESDRDQFPDRQFGSSTISI